VGLELACRRTEGVGLGQRQRQKVLASPEVQPEALGICFAQSVAAREVELAFPNGLVATTGKLQLVTVLGWRWSFLPVLLSFNEELVL
jgi:hypothetical protein